MRNRTVKTYTNVILLDYVDKKIVLCVPDGPCWMKEFPADATSDDIAAAVARKPVGWKKATP
jgi:hypothetical protein